MQPLGDYTGQFWQLSAQSSGYYQLCSRWLGPDYRLGYYIDNASTYHPALFTSLSRYTSKEQWKITSLGDGVFSVTNQDVSLNVNSPLYLDVVGYIPILGGQNYGDNWAWIIKEIQPIDDPLYSSVLSEGTTSSFMSSRSTSAASATASGVNPGVTMSSNQAPGSSATAAPAATAPTSTNAHGTPTGTAVGIGVGVGVAVILIGALMAYMFMRRRRRKTIPEQHDDRGAIAPMKSNQEGKPGVSEVGETYTEPHAELPGGQGNAWRPLSELGGPQIARKYGSSNLHELH